MDDVERILGRLEGVSEVLGKSLDRVLDNQEDASSKFDQHVVEDRQNFDEGRRHFSDIAEGLGILRDRIVKVESMADAVDSHSDAILTIEKRLEDQALERAAARATHQNNVKWMSAAGGIGIAIGTAGNTFLPKVWAAFIKIFG